MTVRADVEADVRTMLERAYSRTDQPHRSIKARGRDRAPRLGWYGVPRDKNELPAQWITMAAAAAAVEGYELFRPTNPHLDARRAVRQIVDASPELVAVWHPYAPGVGVKELSAKLRVPILDIVEFDTEGAVGSLRTQLASHPVLVRPPTPGPVNVAAALELAGEKDLHLVIHDRTTRTAAASPFERPQEVFDGLMAIDAVARRYAAGTLGSGGFEAAFAAEGQSFASGISQTARTRYRAHYEMTHEGATVMMGPHLRIGSGWSPAHCARIYWYVDEKNRKLIIGHVGKHLPGAAD
ncbi:MAG TPA: hypothetical protein VF257_13915 [Solirubrobacteraceae bacterium]